MKLSELQSIFCVNAAKLILYINECGFSCTFGEAYRTPQQAEWNAKNGTGIKNSLHCKRLAVDLNLFKDGVYIADTASWKTFGEYWVSLDSLNRWGGDWDKDGVTEPGENDGNHFEMQPIDKEVA